MFLTFNHLPTRTGKCHFVRDDASEYGDEGRMLRSVPQQHPTLGTQSRISHHHQLEGISDLIAESSSD